MAKITRKNQKILGGSSSNNGQFGSAQVGTFLTSNDPDIIQALPAWDQGWNSATFSTAKLPAIEEAQGVDYVVTRQLAYIFQEGMPEWSNDTEYHEFSIVKEPGTVRLYKSVVDDNVGNALSDTLYWSLLCDLETVQPLDNFTSSVAPTVNDDESEGYSPGSKWYDLVQEQAYLCVDSTNGAAIWVDITLTPDELGALAFKNTVAYTDIDAMTSANLASVVTDETGSGPLVFANGPSIGIPGHIFGVTLSNNGTDAVNDIDISSGRCTDSTGVYNMTLSSILTKRLDAAWAVGSGNGGLDTGSIANTTYHVYIIKRLDTGVVDAIFSTNASAPTLPANYTIYRRIGSIIRAGGTILAFRQFSNKFILQTSVQDVNTTTLGTTAVTSTLASVPNGIVVDALVRAAFFSGTAPSAVLISSLDENDQAPVAGIFGSIQCVVNNSASMGEFTIRTNSAQQVRIRATAASSILRLNTYGWVDNRGTG